MKSLRHALLPLAGIVVVTGCGTVAHFDVGYQHTHRDQVIVEVPEAYELANIAYALTPDGMSDSGVMAKGSAYHARVLEHFGAFRDHPLIEAISFPYDDGRRDNILGWRENSFGYAFEGDQIVQTGTHGDLRRPDSFSRYVHLTESFARKSGFREFYQNNQTFYQEQIRIYEELVPFRQMWEWLELRFPQRSHCYRVVFSPLIGATHSASSFEDEDFRETVVFVGAPGDWRPAPEPLREGLSSRIVFAEISHEYVDAASRKHEKQIQQVFQPLEAWSLRPNPRTAVHAWNEYFTWAVFSMYVDDTFGPESGEAILRSTEQLLKSEYGFLRFTEFNQEALRLYRRTRSELDGPVLLPELYDELLAWCRPRDPA